jgi:hypothetical protein
VNFGKPIHGAAANAAKSMGFPTPKPFASNKYSRYPLTAPQMIGNLRQIPGAATAVSPMIRAVSNPIQASNWLPLTDLTATGARFSPMAATTAPVTMGGIKRSTQPTPDCMTIKAMTPYSTPAAMTPPSATSRFGFGPWPEYPLAAMTTAMNEKLEPK